MAKLTPYFHTQDAKTQAAFYAEALDGEIVQVMTYDQAPAGDGQVKEEHKDKVMHLMLQAAGQTFYMADHIFETVQHGNAISLNLEFQSEEEAQRAFDKLSEGGEVIMPLAKQFWGAMFGAFKDKFGMSWQISTEAHQNG